MKPDEEKTKLLCDSLAVAKERVNVVPEGRWSDPLRFMHRLNENIKVPNNIKKCDFLIDLTQGDSFTDIYGKRRFYNYTRLKKLVEKLGVPLVFGPQTYGPFNDPKVEYYAKKVISGALLVAARDPKSKSYLERLDIKNVSLTTDLAFSLPYSTERDESSKIRIGINISGLLVNEKIEKGLKTFEAKTHYDEYVETILNYLDNDKYQIHIIPHAIEDFNASRKFVKDEYIVHKPFNTPVEVKSCIAGMDIFIGARMHATIAGYSAGVPTIAVAYSRKFTGLFDGLNYPYVVDLQELYTKEAIKRTISYIEDYQKIKAEIEASKEKLQELVSKNDELFQNVLDMACGLTCSDNNS